MSAFRRASRNIIGVRCSAHVRLCYRVRALTDANGRNASSDGRRGGEGGGEGEGDRGRMNGESSVAGGVLRTREVERDVGCVLDLVSSIFNEFSALANPSSYCEVPPARVIVVSTRHISALRIM